MISCNQCGIAISSVARFCKNCGAAISNSDQLNSTLFSLDPKSIGADRIKSTKNLESISQAIFVAPAHFLNTLSEIFSTVGIKPYSILSGNDEMDIKNKIHHKWQQNIDHPPKYICLIGNWDEVPPFKLAAPEIMHDHDEFCVTDAPYGCIQAYDEENIFSIIPDIPVGRIPTIDSEVLIRLFFEEEIKTDANKSFLFAVSAQVWNRATEKIINLFLNSEDNNRLKNDPTDINQFPYRGVLSSPNWYEDDLKKITRQKFDIKNSVILFNVHGGLDEPIWVGEADGKYTKIFDIDTINDFNSSIIISEACYGGALGYDPKSIVEAFFERGGRTFIGSSTIAYGAANENIFGADHIALHFLRAIARGDEFGDALNFSKSEIAKSDSLYKFVGEKTILSFNLFGLPWGRSLPTPSLTSTDDQAFDVTSKLEQIRSRTSSLGVNKGNTLDNIRNRYLSNLSGKNKQFLLNKAEARDKFRRFKDANKINNMLIEWSGNSDDYLLQFFSNNEDEGYALFSQAPGFDKSTKTMILLIDSMGNLNITLTSKGAI